MTEYRDGYLYEIDPIGDVPGVPPRVIHFFGIPLPPLNWVGAVKVSLTAGTALFAIVLVAIEWMSRR